MSIIGMFERLNSEECQNPECGRPKQRMKVFCADCYFKLDEDDRNALYSRDPDYFEEAVKNAIDVLTV